MIGLLLAASVLLHLNPPAVVIYVNGDGGAGRPEAVAAAAACPYLLSQGVPLPVPFEIRWMSPAVEGRSVPSARAVAGLLMRCP